MPEIHPFRAVRYAGAALDVAKLVAPPYDVISPDLQNELYRRHSFNAVRLELPKETDGYAHAAERFRRWRDEGILVRDTQTALYLHEQTFRTEGGGEKTRRGFFCLLKLEEYSRGNVLPHERTLAAPKADRLNIMRTVRANLSPIFGIYSGAPPEIIARLCSTATETLADIANERGERDALRACADTDAIAYAREHLERAVVYIADGHHRYETALAYRDEMRRAQPAAPANAAWNYILMYLCDINDTALEILPIHRIVHSLPRFNADSFSSRLANIFHLETFESFEQCIEALHRLGARAMIFAFPNSPQPLLAALRDDVDTAALYGEAVPAVLRDLSVEILHALVLRNLLGITEDQQRRQTNIRYVHSIAEARSALGAGGVNFAAILNPTTLSQMQRAAVAGVALPQKSTFFYPKLLSGLVFVNLEESIE